MANDARRLIRVLFALATLGVVLVVLAARPGRDRPQQVSTVRPLRQDMTSSITGNGKVEPLEPRVIQAQITTFIEKVLVKEGQTVVRGQTLLTLNATDSLSELARSKEQLVAAEQERRTALSGGAPEEIAQLQTDLAKTSSEIARLRREGETLRRLYAKQAATRDEVEQNRNALEKAEADQRLIEQKKTAVAQRSTLQAERAALRAEEAGTAVRSLEEKLNSARVIAPVTGTLYSLAGRAGVFVHTGDVLAELADLKRVRVRAFVDEPELGSLQVGQPVEITWNALPDRTWVGQVEQLPKTIVARGARSVGEVLCSISNEKTELLPNTNVDVRIRTADRKHALTIPRAAVGFDGVNRFVFKVEGGHLRKHDIKVGIS